MKRLQRLRATPALRDMVAEIGFGQSQLIQPLFLADGILKEEPLSGLPGTSRHTLGSLLTQFEKDLSAGVRQFLLFPVPANKSNRNFAADFASESRDALGPCMPGTSGTRPVALAMAHISTIVFDPSTNSTSMRGFMFRRMASSR